MLIAMIKSSTLRKDAAAETLVGKVAEESLHHVQPHNHGLAAHMHVDRRGVRARAVPMKDRARAANGRYHPIGDKRPNSAY
jgi:hypothetical protein